jgi:hypothetical protein
MTPVPSSCEILHFPQFSVGTGLAIPNSGTKMNRRFI